MGSLRGCRVLIVDDFEDNLLLMETFFRTKGYIVDTANSGALALTKAEASPPDIVLLDLMMPGMDGFEVIQQLRKNDQFSSVAILIITASRDVNEEGLKMGVNGFIFKPVDLGKLLEKVKAFCPC
ncbi:MAG TPA: response regulator [Coleofasciculaceae cyanobacterium]|jgi:DNA-binding response OmpR family regulator